MLSLRQLHRFTSHLERADEALTRLTTAKVCALSYNTVQYAPEATRSSLVAYFIAWRSHETGQHYLPTSVMRRYANNADIVVGGGQLSSTCFGRVDDHRASGVSYCGYYDSAPCGGSACCRPVGGGLRFPDRLQNYVCCDSLLGG